MYPPRYNEESALVYPFRTIEVSSRIIARPTLKSESVHAEDSLREKKLLLLLLLLFHEEESRSSIVSSSFFSLSTAIVRRISAKEIRRQ